ncbi:hypothetical protein BJY00DRAFT_273467 [Aspergillus carlsbadensis]|nr:hypothetical protein BJY00DRAFT_273467 [Aspergillus carlsbadensis]
MRGIIVRVGETPGRPCIFCAGSHYDFQCPLTPKEKAAPKLSKDAPGSAQRKRPRAAEDIAHLGGNTPVAGASPNKSEKEKAKRTLGGLMKTLANTYHTRPKGTGTTT